MNRAQLIRAWLAAHPGPQTSRAITDGIGWRHDPEKAQWTIGVMLRDGQLARVRDTRPMLYAMARDVMSKADTLRLAAEGRERRNAGIRERRKAERLVKQAQDAAVRAQRRKDAEAKRREWERKRNARRTAERALARANRPAPVREAKPPKPEAPRWERQTVEEFLAQGGRIDVLPAGATSQPLRRIGGSA